MYQHRGGMSQVHDLPSSVARCPEAGRLWLLQKCVLTAPLHWVHLHTLVPRTRVPADRRLLFTQNGHLERWLRLLRDHQVDVVLTGPLIVYTCPWNIDLDDVKFQLLTMCIVVTVSAPCFLEQMSWTRWTRSMMYWEHPTVVCCKSSNSMFLFHHFTPIISHRNFTSSKLLSLQSELSLSFVVSC